MAGRLVSAEECDQLWDVWTPAEVAAPLSGTRSTWYVAAGWALDLFVAASDASTRAAHRGREC